MENIDNWLQELYQLNPELDNDVVKKSKGHELDIFTVLNAIDLRKKDFYEGLTPDQKKSLVPWLLMRWTSSSKNNSEHYMLMANDIVNKNFSSLVKHPNLQWKLLSLCGTGKKQMHQWIAPPKKGIKNKLEQEIIKLNPLIKNSDLELLLSINSQEDFEQYFKDNGYSDREIKEILKG